MSTDHKDTMEYEDEEPVIIGCKVLRRYKGETVADFQKRIVARMVEMGEKATIEDGVITIDITR